MLSCVSEAHNNSSVYGSAFLHFYQPPHPFLHRNVQARRRCRLSVYIFVRPLQPPLPFLRQHSVTVTFQCCNPNLWISTRHSVQKVTQTPLMKAQRAKKYKTKFPSARVSVSSLTACHFLLPTQRLGLCLAATARFFLGSVHFADIRCCYVF
jgi:hypothetical protein